MECANRMNHFYDALSFRPPEESINVPGIGRLTFALHDKKDIWISDAIRGGFVMDAHILAVLSALIVPGATFVDVGANIGWFTVIGSRLVGSRGRVIAFEPDPDNVRLLRRAVARNHCGNVTVHPCAVGAESGTARLFRSSDNQGDHRLEVASDRRDSVVVAVRSLDDSLGHAAADAGVIKMDTQGSEAAALRGMRKLLTRNPRVRVVLEFWPFGLQRCGASADALAELFGQRDGALWLISGDGAAMEIRPQDLPELARTRYAPETEAHADLVWLHADDRQGVWAVEQVLVNPPFQGH